MPPTPAASGRTAFVFVAIALAAGCSHTGRAPEPRMAKGGSYTVRSTTMTSGEGAIAASIESQRGAWTGAVITDRTRSRIDLVDGAQRPLFEKGDFMLSDSTDFLIAHPATKTFSVVTTGRTSELQRVADSVGITTTLSDIVVSLDSLGDGESIEGRPSRQYRLTASFAMTIDFSRTGINVGAAAQSRSTTTLTADYWFVELPGALTTPYADYAFRRMDPSGRLAPVWNRARAAMASVRAGRTAVRMKSSTRVVSRNGSGLTTTTVDITNVKFADVDPTLFVLPDDYRETVLPGLAPSSIPSSKDGGARWRAGGATRTTPPPSR